jgi:uncharacterized protein YndB with AHSA1/START domain
MAERQAAQVAQFELEVELDAAPEQAWRALTEEIDRWWLPDFRATGEGSTVRLEVRPGGSLVESQADGTELVWYTVQMVRPGSDLYLVGHIAAEWGGPTISMLKLSLAARGTGSVLSIADSLLGRISDSKLASTVDGWRELFGSGLQNYLARSPAAS